MKRSMTKVSKIKDSMQMYINVPVTIRVNRGRNKIFYYDCKIVDLFPSVFTVELDNKQKQTYSYAGVLCGEIKFKKRDIPDKDIKGVSS